VHRVRGKMDVLTVRYGRDDTGERLARSLRETGFAVVTGHPVPLELMERVYAEWERFFASPDKHRFTFDPKKQDGYFPFRSENAKGYPRKDLKEFFHVYPGTVLPEWMSDSTVRLYGALSSLAGELLALLEDHTPEGVRAGLSMPLRRMIERSPQTLFPPEARRKGPCAPPRTRTST
jgi:hypothetical protein